MTSKLGLPDDFAAEIVAPCPEAACCVVQLVLAREAHGPECSVRAVRDFAGGFTTS